MIRKIYRFIRLIISKHSRKNFLSNYYKKDSQGIILKKLSVQQKKEVKNYYKNLTGKSVSTRTHQLLYSATGVFDVKYLPFEIYEDILDCLSPRPYMLCLDDKNLYRYILKDFTIPQRVVECCNGVYYLPEINGGGRVSLTMKF